MFLAILIHNYIKVIKCVVLNSVSIYNYWLRRGILIWILFNLQDNFSLSFRSNLYFYGLSFAYGLRDLDLLLYVTFCFKFLFTVNFYLVVKNVATLKDTTLECILITLVLNNEGSVKC